MKPNHHAPLWGLDPQVAYLNHGSFGSVPREVQAIQEDYQHRAHTNPNRWFRFELPDLLTAARQSTAHWLGVTEEQFAFVPNASLGVITAVQALVDDVTMHHQQAHLITTSLGYGGVQFGIKHVAQRSSATLRTVTIEYPHEITPDLIASRIREAIPLQVAATILVLDQITSDTGVLIPVDEIITQLKITHPQLRVIVDGAHAPGMLETPLPHDFDVWVGNFHKWLCAPRSAAGIVCATPRIAAMMSPLAASWGYENRFPVSFDWQGTNDYSAYIATPNAIKFQQQWSFTERNLHNTSVVNAGASLLRQAWSVNQHLSTPIEAPWMRMVRLPVSPAFTRKECDALIRRASLELRAETTVMSVGGHNYVRLSAHMYNEANDYQRLVELPKLA